MTNAIIGIDPGMGGGVAGWSYDPSWVEPQIRAIAMPDTAAELVDFLSCYSRSSAYIEQVPWVIRVGGRNIGGASIGKLHQNMGTCLGILAALRIRTILAHPKTWQKALGLHKAPGSPQANWKRKLKAEAQRRYPGIAVTLATADAILIMEYGRRLEIAPALEWVSPQTPLPEQVQNTT